MPEERRGYIISPDGKAHRVPEALLEKEEMAFPGLPQGKPGPKSAMPNRSEIFRRHEIVEGKVYVFLQSTSQLSDIPEKTMLAIKRDA